MKSHFVFSAHTSLLPPIPLSPQCEAGNAVTLPESLLFVSTLDGSLHAVSKQSGDIKWTLKEGQDMVPLHILVCVQQSTSTHHTL